MKDVGRIQAAITEPRDDVTGALIRPGGEGGGVIVSIAGSHSTPGQVMELMVPRGRR